MSTPSRPRIFISAVFEVQESLLSQAAITAPANYKDPAKIEEYISKARADLVNRARGLPYYSVVKELLVAIPAKRLVTRWTLKRDAEQNIVDRPAVNFRRWLSGNFASFWDLPVDMSSRATINSDDYPATRCAWGRG